MRFALLLNAFCPSSRCHGPTSAIRSMALDPDAEIQAFHVPLRFAPAALLVQTPSANAGVTWNPS